MTGSGTIIGVALLSISLRLDEGWVRAERGTGLKTDQTGDSNEADGDAGDVGQAVADAEAQPRQHQHYRNRPAVQ